MNGRRDTVMQIYNNYLFSSMAIFSILKHKEKWKMSEIALILPMTTQTKIVKSLNKRKKDISLLDLIVDKSDYFYNFNKMFHSYRITSINCIVLLIQMDLINFDKGNGEIIVNKNYPVDKIIRIINKDSRLKAIDKSSEKICKMLKEKISVSELYIQLGVIL